MFAVLLRAATPYLGTKAGSGFACGEHSCREVTWVLVDKVQGFRVSGLGFRVRGLGFRVKVHRLPLG